MFLITIPLACASECRYTLDVIMRQWLGVELEIREDRLAESISIAAAGKSIALPTPFFLSAGEHWLRAETLLSGRVHELSFGLTDACPGTVPVFEELISNRDLPLVTITSNQAVFNFDLFGGAFYLLSRYEEVVLPDRDAIGRFPAESAAQVKAGLITRPLVNEYVECLWQVIQVLWPQCDRRKREFRMTISHDIDHLAFHRQYSLMRGLKRSIRAFLDRDPSMAIRFIASRKAVLNGELTGDPFFTLNELMDESESRGFTSTFYFMAGGTDPLHDEDYKLTDPSVRQALVNIINRGHQLGVHPSYNTFDDPEAISREIDNLRSTVEALGSSQREWGSRQHYLRWETATTPGHLESAGISHDSTLGFAEQPGFRCGTCYEYPLYDFRKRRSLGLRERPLIVMDCSVMDPHYLGLGTGRRALEAIHKLKEECRRYRGDFSLLWHNTRVVRRPERRLYLSVLDI
jgi:hypothetical protein